MSGRVNGTTLVMAGVSHQTAPLGLLERLSVSSSELPGVLTDLREGEVAGIVVLSTCNRTELYASCRQFHPGVEQLATFLAARVGLPLDELVPHLAVLHDDRAVGHLFRVAAGAESAVPGETEILGQVQRALAAAESQPCTDPLLRRAFRHAVRVGRRARSETAVALGPTSLPRLAVRWVTDQLGTLGNRHILVVGAGEIGGAVAVALARNGAGSVSVAGRGAERAAAVAAAADARAVSADDLGAALEDADVVFTATSSPGYLLDAPTCAWAMARRRERPLLVVDLALPRDVDPAVRALPNVTLVDLDGLQTMVAEALAERRRHLPEVERLVREEVERFLRETSARAVSPLVSALRCRVEEVRRAELARWQGRLNELDPGAAALAETITAGVVAKLLHAPTVRLRDAAGTADAALYHDALVELFDLAISSPPGGTREYAA